MKYCSFVALLCGLLAEPVAVQLATRLDASDAVDPELGSWPGWRGKDGVGVARDTLPLELDDQTLRWKWSDPGRGHSSPIVWGEAIFLTTAIETSRVLLRIDAKSGKEVWRREVIRADKERKHLKNSFASSTPATDGKLVYVSFLGTDLRVVIAAYDYSGKEAWRASPGTFFSRHGFCSTAVIHEDLVIFNCDQDAREHRDQGAESYIVAYERTTGSVRWKTIRGRAIRSYCPPTIFKVDGKYQMVLSGSETVTSYDPATGKLIWFCEGPTEQCVASLVYGSGLVFVTGGFPERHFLAIDPSGAGDVTKTHIRWRARKGPAYVPSPLYWNGHFYCICDETGVISALDARTGKYVKQKRLAGGYSASLLLASNHIFAFSERGDVTVLGLAPEMETVAQWKVDAPIYATPAVAGDTMYLRTWKTLYAMGAR